MVSVGAGDAENASLLPRQEKGSRAYGTAKRDEEKILPTTSSLSWGRLTASNATVTMLALLVVAAVRRDRGEGSVEGGTQENGGKGREGRSSYDATHTLEGV